MQCAGQNHKLAASSPSVVYSQDNVQHQLNIKSMLQAVLENDCLFLWGTLRGFPSWFYIISWCLFFKIAWKCNHFFKTKNHLYKNCTYKHVSVCDYNTERWQWNDGIGLTFLKYFGFVEGSISLRGKSKCGGPRETKAVRKWLTGELIVVGAHRAK